MSSLRKRLTQIDAVKGQMRTAAQLGLERRPIINDDPAKRLRALPVVGPQTAAFAPMGDQHDSGIGHWDEARQIHVLRTEHVTHPTTTGCTHRAACDCQRRQAA